MSISAGAPCTVCCKFHLVADYFQVSKYEGGSAKDTKRSTRSQHRRCKHEGGHQSREQCFCRDVHLLAVISLLTHIDFVPNRWLIGINIISISPDGHSPCCSMPAWVATGRNTQYHALLMPTWAHDGPGCMDSHGTAWSPPHGHGLVRIHVCMAAHGPLNTPGGQVVPWPHGPMHSWV